MNVMILQDSLIIKLPDVYLKIVGEYKSQKMLTYVIQRSIKKEERITINRESKSDHK